jgi:catalase
LQSLEAFRSDATGQALRTNQGVKVADNQNTLKAGAAGRRCWKTSSCARKSRTLTMNASRAHRPCSGHRRPWLLSVLRKPCRADQGRLPAGPKKKTPVFVRFSTVQGPRGSGDTVRDVRGFAVKFFTDEGNFDLVGNNMPVFFIQDAIKFPDFVHAVKPEPHNEIPTGGSAHDTFWDFVSLVPESAHMVIWAMSDRAIPKSLRSMAGLWRAHLPPGQCRRQISFVKFHWKPRRACSLVWDERRSWPARTPTTTAATCGKPSRPATTLNGSWACRSSRRKMNTGSTSTCSTRPS